MAGLSKISLIILWLLHNQCISKDSGQAQGQISDQLLYAVFITQGFSVLVSNDAI